MLGWVGGSQGTYLISSGNAEFGNLTLGCEGTGYFKQSGGTVIVDGTLILAQYENSHGTYELAGGTLIADDIQAGLGDAVFLLTGGTFSPPEGPFGPKLVNAGALLQPGGTGVTTLTIDRDYIQGPNGTLEITMEDSFHLDDLHIDALEVGGLCQLDGGISVVIMSEPNFGRPDRRHMTYKIITAESVSGGFSWYEGRYPDRPVDTTSYDQALGLFTGRVDPNDSKAYVLEFLGYTKGDINGNGRVDGGDLAILGASWEMSGISWGPTPADPTHGGNFNQDLSVDAGDLSLMARNWMWSCSCPICNPGGKDGGREARKFDDGGLDLSDRNGDGVFDIKDMLIIIEEMNKVPSEDSHAPDQPGAIDPSAGDGAPPGGQILPGEGTDGQSRTRPVGPALAAVLLDSPLFWPACWIGGVAALLRPPRRRR